MTRHDQNSGPRHRVTPTRPATAGSLAVGLLLLLGGCGAAGGDDDVDASTSAAEEGGPSTIAASGSADRGSAASEDDEQEQEQEQDQDPVTVATAFWEALEDGDVAAATDLADPAIVDSTAASPFGRAQTLAGQFDWYEAVGWQWELDECTADDAGRVQCTAAVTNDWSEALGVDPVRGTFDVTVGDNGIGAVSDRSSSFVSQWSPLVFDVFRDWVRENHSEDAAVMFDFDRDVDNDILTLYETNTERFVEAVEADGVG